MSALNSNSSSVSDLVLYQSETCWFCGRVRQALAEMQVNLVLRDIDHDLHFRQELASGGGKTQVPCLRIQHPDQRVEWMYESADIIQYLAGRFAPWPA